MKKVIHASIMSSCIIVSSTMGITTHAQEKPNLKSSHQQRLRSNRSYFIPPKFTSVDTNIEGKVRFYGLVNNTFGGNYLNDHILGDDEIADNVEWMKEHYDVAQVYAPWFDEFTAHSDGSDWYTNGYEYKDLYAIYDCGQEVNFNSCNGDNSEHEYMYELAMQAEADPNIPDWIMKDDDGNPLYIPFECNTETGLCPQFAADLTNPAFRQLWIAQMKTALDGGVYRGLFVDDVNLDRNRALSDGHCTLMYWACDWTIDMSEEQWAESVASFVEEIRAEFPDREIVHNIVWFNTDFQGPEYPEDPYLDREIDAADIISFERGINDANMTLDAGIFGIEAFLRANDYVHRRGRSMVHLIKRNPPCGGSTPCILQQPLTDKIKLIQYEYGLAGWLLVSEGQDFFGAIEFNTPDDWWHGFDTDLGQALGERYTHPSNGLYIREFEKGVVLLNAPGDAAVPLTINLSQTFYTLEGEPVTNVTMPIRTGKILLRESPKVDFSGPTGLQSN